MMDDDASPLLNDCLISDAYKIPGSPGLPNVFLLDVMSEFNSDYSLTDFKPVYVGVGGGQSNNEIPLDISHMDRPDNSKDHCYISESQSSILNGIHPKSYVKLEAEDSYCPSSLPLTRVHKEICVKTEVYTVKPSTTLVVSNVPSQNLTVLTRQRSDDWSQASESPGALSPDDYSDSSNGGSEYFTPSPAPSTIMSNGCRTTASNVNFSVRTRSKMQELALQQNLITNQDLKSNGQLQLSTEERRTLMQEGYNVPTCLPLTKKDEEALKLVRRKIKNKLSAQESRRRRKEYIDTLEKRLHNFQTENNNLKRRVENLEQNNQNLIGQLRKLQSTIGRSANQIPTPSAGVTLAAFLLLFAVLIPTFPVWSQVSFLVKANRQMSLELDLKSSTENFHHGPSRVLTSNECDLHNSAAGYFHELIRSKDGCDEFPSSKLDNTDLHSTTASADDAALLRDYSNGDASSLVDGGPGFNNLSDGGDGGQKSTKNSNCIGLACHQAAVLTDS